MTKTLRTGNRGPAMATSGAAHNEKFLSSARTFRAVQMTLKPFWAKMSTKLAQALGFKPMFLTLVGDAMFAMTRWSLSKIAKTSFGDTFGCPASSTVASQHKMLRLAAFWTSGVSMWTGIGFVMPNVRAAPPA